MRVRMAYPLGNSVLGIIGIIQVEALTEAWWFGVRTFHGNALGSNPFAVHLFLLFLFVPVRKLHSTGRTTPRTV